MRMNSEAFPSVPVQQLHGGSQILLKHRAQSSRGTEIVAAIVSPRVKHFLTPLCNFIFRCLFLDPLCCLCSGLKGRRV